jgi:predicted DNA-binding protein
VIQLGNKVLRSIYLDVAQVERIKRLSDITKVPQAVYVREGLDLLLRKYEEKMGSDSQQFVAEEQA